MINSTHETFNPSKGTIMLICSVARQYAAMKRRENTIHYNKYTISPTAQA